MNIYNFSFLWLYDTIMLGDSMAKYAFVVYLPNKEKKLIFLKELEKANLQEMDLFVLMHGKNEVEEMLAKELNVPIQSIEKVGILQIRKSIEFSLCLGNQYLTPILTNMMEDHKLLTTHPICQQMKDYLFRYLHSEDYRTFLEKIYYYDNQFHFLLERYCMIYHQTFLGEEEENELKKYENKILDGFKIYKNYRGLCICRKRWEEKAISVILPKTVSNLKVSSHLSGNLYHLSDSRYTYLSMQERASIYNREYDEYLSPEEYAMMQGEQEDEPYQYH